MPRVFQLKNASSSDVTVAYSIDNAVGRGCPNQREDVLLVQHLLRIAWEDAPTSKGFRPPAETRPLNVDGFFGQTTARFIEFFQQEAQRRGVQISQDGRVDPVLSGGTRGALSNTFYTILALNSARNSRRAFQSDIASDPGFPQELMRHFYVVWNSRV